MRNLSRWLVLILAAHVCVGAGHCAHVAVRLRTHRAPTFRSDPQPVQRRRRRTSASSSRGRVDDTRLRASVDRSEPRHRRPAAQRHVRRDDGQYRVRIRRRRSRAVGAAVVAESRNAGAQATAWIGPVHHGILGTPCYRRRHRARCTSSRSVAEGRRIQFVGERARHLHRQSQIQLSTAPVVSVRRTGRHADECEGRTAARGAARWSNDVLVISLWRTWCPIRKTRHWSQEGFLPDIQRARSHASVWRYSRRPPPDGKGGIWQGGRGIATDGAGNHLIYPRPAAIMTASGISEAAR